MTSITRKPILIAGGGIASLLLAQSLRRASIPFLIFERDSTFSFRAQGYRLRLSSEGLDAVEAVVGPEDFSKFWELCGKTSGNGQTVLDAISGAQIVQSPNPASDSAKHEVPPNLQSRGGQIVGISRGDMRQNFMIGCEPFIQWSHVVTGYELTSSGVHALFADGSKSIEGEMLVGGEGIHSKVAKQLSKGILKVYDTGARGIHGQAPIKAFHSLGEGVWQIRDNSRPGGQVSMITNVRRAAVDETSLDLGWAVAAQPGIINAAANTDDTITGSSAADIAKSLTSQWHPRFQPLFTQMVESEAAFWKITCSTPTGVPEWQNEQRVTVIGDAAHSMTPAGGLGANTAIRDSALLGSLLVEARGFATDVTRHYESQMRSYASEAVRTSYNMAIQHFGILVDEDSPVL